VPKQAPFSNTLLLLHDVHTNKLSFGRIVQVPPPLLGVPQLFGQPVSSRVGGCVGDPTGASVAATGVSVDGTLKGGTVDTAGEAVNAVGDAVEAVGEAVGAVGDTVDAVGDAVDAVGDTVVGLSEGDVEGTAVGSIVGASVEYCMRKCP
jgi:hypothetical protein